MRLLTSSNLLRQMLEIVPISHRTRSRRYLLTLKRKETETRLQACRDCLAFASPFTIVLASWLNCSSYFRHLALDDA